MLRGRLSLLLAVALLLPSLSHAQGLINKVYKSPKSAALHAGAFAFSRNSVLRQSLGTVTARRVMTKGSPTLTRSGQIRFTVVTRKTLRGSKQPVAEVPVTVKPTKAGLRAYIPGKTKVKINQRPGRGSGWQGGGESGWRFVGRETWIEQYGAEGPHRNVPGGVLVPTGRE